MQKLVDALGKLKKTRTRRSAAPHGDGASLAFIARSFMIHYAHVCKDSRCTCVSRLGYAAGCENHDDLHHAGVRLADF